MSDKDFDDILTSLGTGKWNFFHIFWTSLTGLVVPSLLLSGAFFTPNMDHQCEPLHNEEDIYKINECSYTDGQNETYACTSWKYETKFFPNTITNEFDLVCDKAYLRPTFQSSYMFGNFIGAIFNGFLADRFGRRRLVMVGTTALILCGMLMTVFYNIYIIISLRFIMGLFHTASRPTSCILCMEITEPKYRSVVGVTLGLPWAIGMTWYGVLGYLVRDWRLLQRIALIPGIVAMILIRYYTESPRWLIVNGRFDEAMNIIKGAAILNGATLPPENEIISRMKRIQSSSLSKARNTEDDVSKKTFAKNLINLLTNLFRTRELRKLIFKMYFLFFTVSMVYYGLSLNAANFNLDPYMYIIVGGITELPAYTLTFPLINKYGRIPITVICYLAGGVVILVLAFISNAPKWLIITLAMSGRMFTSSAFQLIYLIAAEVFPTEVRMQGIASSQVVSRIGSIIAPFLTELVAATYQWIPSIIFGVISISAGFVTFFVPETLNSHLPETIAMVEMKNAKNKDNTIRCDDEVQTSINMKNNRNNENDV